MKYDYYALPSFSPFSFYLCCSNFLVLKKSLKILDAKSALILNKYLDDFPPSNSKHRFYEFN